MRPTETGGRITRSSVEPVNTNRIHFTASPSEIQVQPHGKIHIRPRSSFIYYIKTDNVGAENEFTFNCCQHNVAQPTSILKTSVHSLKWGASRTKPTVVWSTTKSSGGLIWPKIIIQRSFLVIASLNVDQPEGVYSESGSAGAKHLLFNKLDVSGW